MDGRHRGDCSGTILEETKSNPLTLSLDFISTLIWFDPGLLESIALKIFEFILRKYLSKNILLGKLLLL